MFFMKLKRIYLYLLKKILDTREVVTLSDVEPETYFHAQKTDRTS